MKLEKAIEHLNAIKESGEYLGDPDDSRAVQLGIEAMKRVKAQHKDENTTYITLLPGETE